MHRFHIPYHEAPSKLPTADGKRYAEVFNHGTLLMELYKPRGGDLQTPHSRDEGYSVVKGSGEYINGNDRVTFSNGNFLFTALGDIHRFENFTDDLSVRVIFYGPERGEET